MTVPIDDAMLPVVPPEWVELAAAPQWIDRRYGEGAAAAIVPELILAVRNRTLRHRIRGIKPRNSPHGIQLPPGLDFERDWSGNIVDRNWIVVKNWEAAEADWTFGTVGGWEQRDGTRERLPIELSWEAIAYFMSMILPRLQRQVKSATATKIAPQPKQKPKSRQEALADALVSLHQERTIDLNTKAIGVVDLGKMADQRVGAKPPTHKPTVERALQAARARIAGG
jgi:hypothetical protein